MLNPVATYRVQLHKDFNFAQLRSAVDYLVQLGIGCLYASPVFEAVPGSTHGYDGLHPHRINPEIGSMEELKQLSQLFRDHGIGWLQDIVPNHMGFHPGNEWLMDVLEKGRDSKYAAYFDIDWKEKIMVPFLGKPLDEAIDSGEVSITQVEGKSFVKYYDQLYPLTGTTDAKQNYSPEELKALLDQQHYRLCSWKETDSHINYRRFFTINSLICVNIQDAAVFENYHKLIRDLVADGTFNGLRIDHIDGLYDPTEYLHQLRIMAGEDTHITVEKILQPGEPLPQHWPVQGNTGYDFLALVNNLFTRQQSAAAFTEFYQQLANDFSPLEQHVLVKKSQILYSHMQGELDNLFRLFKDSALVNKRAFASIRQDELKEAIAEFLIQCPVYRYYGNSMPLDQSEAGAIQQVFNKIRSQNSELSAAIDLLEQALLHLPHQGDEERNQRAAHFYRRCMQFTGPLMAKGVEDTLMYTYNRFIGHNEVGDQPASFGISKAAFHEAMAERQQHWPYSLNATSTHDTKRGEDTRARLNVLTDLPEAWFEQVSQWQEQHRDIKGIIDDNDAYFIYQALLGGWPMPGEDEASFKERVIQYLEKALREAKTNSNWTEPNQDYENAIKDFVSSLLEPASAFRESMEKFLGPVTDHGIINSLTQLVLKFTCPGVPDVYQGCESWDLSFVDPDNRRPVDYGQRAAWLDEIRSLDDENPFTSLWEQRHGGKIKLWLTHQMLQLRKQQPELFAQGEYIPLEVLGAYREHVIAFARKYRQQVYIIALPLHTAVIGTEQQTGPLSIDWKDTRVQLPPDVHADWEDVFSQERQKFKTDIPLVQAFNRQPFLLMKGRVLIKERSAGLLLHITSLPSPYGIGDLGPEAKAFADFLYRSKQKYWQLLPLNPTEGGQGYSPYSAVSAMAGNPMLISPELLAREGLLDHKELAKYRAENEGRVNYAALETAKEEMLNKAFWSWIKQDKRREFDEFRQKEAWWLDDFATFKLLKQLHHGKPWYEWKPEYKHREAQAIKKLEADHADELYRIAWLQFVFAKQWKELKNFCNERNISLIGDLPIYVSYDSADVWSHPQIFLLDKSGKALGRAGVPPDAFSDEGQLWGMPVFNWQVLKERGYDWWIDRVKRNRELFDLIRIDHFRAFAAYWEVPADAPTAKTGEWKPGPGSDFFNAIQDAIGELPFIAEDLGDVDETVFALRDEFVMPGMKVLQFAFGGDMPRSLHIPHNHSRNFIVYTGTHDNNTTLGWYKEADETTRQMLHRYADRHITEEDVHWILCRMAYASVARIAILPMQDVLNLDSWARMNTPSSAENNWAWRLKQDQLNKSVEEKLRQLVEMYNR